MRRAAEGRESRRHGGRHGLDRAARLHLFKHRAAARHHRTWPDAGRTGHGRHRQRGLFRRSLRHVGRPRRQSAESESRPAFASFSAGNHAAGLSGRLVNHARQNQSGHAGNRDVGGDEGSRQSRHDRAGRLVWHVANQRISAADRAWPAGIAAHA